MKTTRLLTCLVLILSILPFAVIANVEDDRRQKAERYYQKGDYKKAYKTYLKSAKSGDHYSQYMLAQMFSKGQGTKTNLIEAYAWAELAAEGDLEEAPIISDKLLQQVEDKAKAQKQAEKLKSKYGVQALAEKASRKSKRSSSGSCTGSRLACYTS